jgi:hypothetical protein
MVNSLAQFSPQNDRYGMSPSNSSSGYGVSGAHHYKGGMTPLASSASTFGSNNQATAWRTQTDNLHVRAGTAESRGSVRNFDTKGQTPRIEVG